MQEPVIFLDIDGVLNTLTPDIHSACPILEGVAARKARELNDPAIERLGDRLVSQILTGFDAWACQTINDLCQRAHASIVITSSWRLLYTRSELQAILKVAGIEQIADTLPAGYIRRDVITGYIRSHRIRRYVIIDDMDLSKPFGFRFIHCPAGFTPIQERKVRSALACQ